MVWFICGSVRSAKCRGKLDGKDVFDSLVYQRNLKGPCIKPRRKKKGGGGEGSGFVKIFDGKMVGHQRYFVKIFSLTSAMDKLDHNNRFRNSGS